MGNVSSAAAADTPDQPVRSIRPESLTLRMYSMDRDEPVVERMPAPAAESLFAASRDHADAWPAIVAAELVGDDDDVLDRW